MRRLTIVLAFIVLFTAGFSYLLGVYSQKFFDRTAPAQWIWARHNMSANEPLAFFAAREFDLPQNPVYVRLKLAADPEYTLYLNGREIAGRRVGEDKALDLYDLSGLVQTGRNRIVIAVRAPQGLGGLLASLDIAPETENWMVTDGRWKIYRRWDPLLLQYDVSGLWESPQIIGAPPIGRWNFLDVVKRPLPDSHDEILTAQETAPIDGQLPTIRTQGGVTVAGSERAKATAFDFGFTRGRVRVAIERPRAFSRLVQLRFANAASELAPLDGNLRPVVLAPGEMEVTTPEEHSFRYVLAFARDVQVTTIRQSPAQ